MRTTAGLRDQAAVCGFTLIELLLTVVLLMLLAGVLVVNFSAMQTSVQLDEAAEQLESTVRFARAYAASSGCKVRLRFEEQIDSESAAPLGNLFVEWEPDGVRKPGVFEPLREVQGLVESFLDSAQVDDVRPLDAPTIPKTDSEAGSEVDLSFAPVVFYPDGSSDSAEIIIASRDEEATRRISLTIVGATGVIRRADVMEPGSENEEWMNEFSE